jgi:cell wall-associated NlpC family hydrolase
MAKAGLLTALGVLLATTLVVATHSAKAQTSLTPAELQYAAEPYTTYTTYTNKKAKKRIMRTARSYAGTPFNQYTWSCSDFTRAVYGNSVGVWMPAWDDQQRFYGYHPKGLQRGDLVFFREYAGNGPVTHVGVYSGGGYIWHSSNYWESTVKTAMMYIPGFQAQYTRRIR